ncbi:hypothetical protein P0F65_00995 [Sphingomonas sp. I4]
MIAILVGAAAGMVATPVQAQSAREILTQASFADSDEASALRRVTSAYNAALAALRRSPTIMRRC